MPDIKMNIKVLPAGDPKKIRMGFKMIELPGRCIINPDLIHTLTLIPEEKMIIPPKPDKWWLPRNWGEIEI